LGTCCLTEWFETFQSLKFKQKNVDCIVPPGYERDKSLGNWVHRQRTFHTQNKIRQDRKDLLNELEFVWRVDNAEWHPDSVSARGNSADRKWHQKYEKLIEFNRKNGHRIVPQSYEQDKSLGNWVNTQWTYQNANKLRPDRKELLDKISFAWKSKGGVNDTSDEQNGTGSMKS
jgi:hypothetical protein